MRGWTALLTLLIGCEGSDSATGDDDSTLSDTDVPADTDVPDDTDLPATGDCRTFAACGGDVVGDWSVDKVCFPDLGNPFLSVCETSTYVFEVTAAGTVDIVNDGTYAADFTITTVNRLTIPPECNSGLAACSDWTATIGLTCTGDLAVACTCESTSPPIPTQTAGAWDYDSGDVVFEDFTPATGEGGGGNVRMSYCRDADTLSFKQVQGGPLTLQYDLSL